MTSKRIHAMCADLFDRLCANGGPEQKVIIFNRDAHADRVALELSRIYADWCRRTGATPKDQYAFKCTANGGSDLIGSMRGSGERCFVACTVDLLATGVDIERLNAVVFFRYLESSITFYQMVGRGTRIHEPTHKYKFWLYDCTGVTRLFGTEFISKPRKLREKGPDGDDDDGGEVDPRTASVGFVAIMARPMATSQDFANWVCGDALEPEFLMHALIRSRGELRALAAGATHKTIYMPTLQAFQLCLPHKAEQQLIVAGLKQRLAAVERMRIALQVQLADLEALPTRLLAAAFDADEPAPA